jgi:Ca-activated chloride channel homolog
MIQGTGNSRDRITIATIVALLLIAAGACVADIGILLPGDREEPNPAQLSLDEVSLDIRIDHQYARVKIIQIFGNHTGGVLEGKYVFAVPQDAAISDFAVWDGVVRIPGVILERKRASELYEEIKMQQIDPGLLQQEEGAEGGRMASAFSARIVPIPPYGTKRLEIEYTQRIAIDGMRSLFSLPLKPDLFRPQQAGLLKLSVEVNSDAPLADFQVVSSSYPLRYDAQTTQKIAGSFEASQILLSEDFAFQYRVAQPRSEIYFLPYRGSERSLRKEGEAISATEAPPATTSEDGYFWASAIWNEKGPALSRTPKSIVILLDISSSMRWEKLEQSYHCLEYFLQHLQPDDEFQLILFHQETKAFKEQAVPATGSNVAAALNFVKSQYLMGGTDLIQAMRKAFAPASTLKSQERYLIWITDGNPTLTQVQSQQILEEFRTQNHEANFRAFCFGIGTDSNRNLLSAISDNSKGHFDWVRETEDLTFKLQNFFAKIGQFPISDLKISSSAQDLIYQVYPSHAVDVYDGSSVDWFGRYKQPSQDVLLEVTGEWEGHPVELQKRVEFPEQATDHDFIPRGWAKERVEFLLRKIEMEGEDQALIDEIIALAKKYKFVTPYTSFLAAPRSLLRPRIIRPGDPILRVRTDPEIVSVTAIFPFGLVKELLYLPAEKIWQTRFLVPKEMADGNYECRLILQDRHGGQYQEKKTYVVDSRPPVFHAVLPPGWVRGSKIKLVVAADSDTRSLYAKFDTYPAVSLRWDPQAKACVGYLRVPSELLPGTYQLQIIGEDFAHNTSRSAHKVQVY